MKDKKTVKIDPTRHAKVAKKVAGTSKTIEGFVAEAIDEKLEAKKQKA